VPASASTHQLAQINIGRMLAPLDDPIMADFVANLDPINALADTSPGFAWRFQTPEGNATAERPYDDDRIIVNFSVWADAESLRQYVYQSAHAAIMRRRREWFERMTDMFIALWWVPAGHRPSIAEAVERLEHLRRHGSSPYAFTFRDIHPAPGASAGASADSPVDASGPRAIISIADACPAG
jgi:hypothetical protein